MTLTSILTGILASLAAVLIGFCLGLPFLALAGIYPVAGILASSACQWLLEQHERLAADP